MEERARKTNKNVSRLHAVRPSAIQIGWTDGQIWFLITRRRWWHLDAPLSFFTYKFSWWFTTIFLLAIWLNLTDEGGILREREGGLVIDWENECFIRYLGRTILIRGVGVFSFRLGGRHGASDGPLAFAYHQLPLLILPTPPHTATQLWWNLYRPFLA